MSDGLFQHFLRRLPVERSATFVERPDGSTISYAQMLDKSGRIAGALRAAGVRPGDRIAVQTRKSPDVLALYLGALRAGAIYLPLNDAYTPEEVGYFLGDAEPALFVCAPERADALGPLAASAGVGRLETLGAENEGTLPQAAAKAPEGFIDHPAGRDDLAAILYTSGTTGPSKGAMLTHGNLASNAATLADLWRFGPGDRLLHALPLFHTHGLFVATNVTLMAGASLILLPSFDLEEVVRLLPRASVMMGVPTFYVRLLAHPRLAAAAGGVRLFVSGSAPLAATTHAEFEERTGHAILERYGMTETNMNSSNPYDGERVPGSVGPPLPDVEIRIAAAETGAPLPAGSVGGIEVRGPNVSPGYWRRPDKMAEDFRADGFFVTGDLGRFDKNGYLHIVGRSKDLIISGGFNVYPAEVEAVIEKVPGVGQCAVVGVPHPDFGEGVVAVLTARGGATPSEPMLREAVAPHLARFKQPKRYFIVDSLPTNAMGKVQKNVLRETYAQAFDGVERLPAGEQLIETPRR